MLEHYRDRNVLGVFAHPHALRAHLAEAREAIGRAEEIVRKTQWPTEGKSAAGKAVLMGALGSPLEAALGHLWQAAGWPGPIQDL